MLYGIGMQIKDKNKRVPKQNDEITSFFSLPIFLESILIDRTVALAYEGKKVNVLGFHVNNPRCP